MFIQHHSLYNLGELFDSKMCEFCEQYSSQSVGGQANEKFSSNVGWPWFVIYLDHFTKSGVLPNEEIQKCSLVNKFAMKTITGNGILESIENQDDKEKSYYVIQSHNTLTNRNQ